MKLQFTEAEINAGVRHAVGLMGFDLTGKEVQVEYSMGRKNNGLSAEVNIINPLIQGAASAPKAEPVVIKGFTDTDPAEETKSPVTVETTADAASAPAETPAAEPEVAVPAGADAAALFGDD